MELGARVVLVPFPVSFEKNVCAYELPEIVPCMTQHIFDPLQPLDA